MGLWGVVLCVWGVGLFFVWYFFICGIEVFLLVLVFVVGLLYGVVVFVGFVVVGVLLFFVGWWGVCGVGGNGIMMVELF